MTAARRPLTVTEPVTALLIRTPNNCDVVLPSEPIVYLSQGLLEALVLSTYLFDPRRRRPVIVVTPTRHGQLRIDPDLLASQAWKHTDVVCVGDHETALALCASLPSWLTVHNGHARLYAPGADVADEGRRHPTFKHSEHGRLPDRIVETAARAARERHHDPAVALETERRNHAATRQELSNARQEISTLRSAADNEHTGRAVYSDPGVQFEHDLYTAWLHAVPETDRDTWDLTRDYTLGPGFLDSVGELQIVSRERIMRACVDVITGRYAEIPGREAKLLLDGGFSTTAKGRPAIVRETDGAKAWRCAVQTRGAAAARLMWWEIPGGGAELSRVAEHDDARII